MKMTQELKNHLIASFGVKATASEEEFLKTASDALLAGTLDGRKYAELCTDKKAQEANQFAEKLDRVATGLEKLLEVATKETTVSAKTPEQLAAEKAAGTTTAVLATKEVKSEGRLTKMFRIGSESVEGGEKDIEVRVKEAAEAYSDTKSTLTYPAQTKGGRIHPLAGEIVKDFDNGSTMNTPSDRDKAVSGAFAQYLVAKARLGSKTIAWAHLPQHSKELVMYAATKMEWGGAGDKETIAANQINRRKLTDLEVKGLIDDAVSGGTEAVPIVFDDQIVTTPILQGEFFPLVNLIPLDKGRRVQGAQAAIVSSEWGGVDDTSIDLFDTASYVSAFDTTIYRWQGAIWIGLDFLSDTPIDFGQFLTQQYGEVMLRDFDSAICVGDGATQPQGIMNKAGTSVVNFGGTTTLSNYETLRFGVHKREHLANLMKTAVFGGTDISYQRAKAIPVGATDARRLNSVMQLPNYDDYSWMGRPFKINESLTNSQIFYAILGRYRMYRRRGLTIRNSVEGDTLIRRNDCLITATARVGGQLERGAAASVTTTAPS